MLSKQKVLRLTSICPLLIAVQLSLIPQRSHAFENQVNTAQPDVGTEHDALHFQADAQDTNGDLSFMTISSWNSGHEAEAMLINTTLPHTLGLSGLNGQGLSTLIALNSGNTNHNALDTSTDKAKGAAGLDNPDNSRTSLGMSHTIDPAGNTDLESSLRQAGTLTHRSSAMTDNPVLLADNSKSESFASTLFAPHPAYASHASPAYGPSTAHPNTPAVSITLASSAISEKADSASSAASHAATNNTSVYPADPALKNAATGSSLGDLRLAQTAQDAANASAEARSATDGQAGKVQTTLIVPNIGTRSEISSKPAGDGRAGPGVDNAQSTLSLDFQAGQFTLPEDTLHRFISNLLSQHPEAIENGSSLTFSYSVTDALGQSLLNQTFTASNIEQIYRLITEKTLDIGTITGLMHLDQHEVLSLVFKLNLHPQTQGAGIDSQVALGNITAHGGLNAVPLPASAWLLASGWLGLMGLSRACRPVRR